MRINVDVTQRYEVDLSERQMNDITICVLRKLYDIPENPVKRKGALYNNVEYAGGSHSYDEDVFYRELKPNDKVILDTIRELRK